jgi:hypothetical protein
LAQTQVNSAIPLFGNLYHFAQLPLPPQPCCGFHSSTLGYRISMMVEIPCEFCLVINWCPGDLSGLQKRDHPCVFSIRVRNLVKGINLRSSLFLIPQIFKRTCDSEDCSQSLLVLLAQNREGTSRSGPTILNATENFHRNQWAEESLVVMMLQRRESVVNFDTFLAGKASVDLCCHKASICFHPDIFLCSSSSLEPQLGGERHVVQRLPVCVPDF